MAARLRKTRLSRAGLVACAGLFVGPGSGEIGTLRAFVCNLEFGMALEVHREISNRWSVIELNLHNSRGAEVSCLGVRSRDGWLATAAHCVPPGSSDVVVSFCGHRAGGLQVIRYPGYDFALLVPPGVVPSIVREEPVQVYRGEWVHLIHRNGSSTHRSGVNNAHRDGAKVTSVRAQIHAVTSELAFVRLEAGGPCRGDSGGPLFVERSSGVELAGVLVQGSPGCRGLFGYQLIPSMAEDN